MKTFPTTTFLLLCVCNAFSMQIDSTLQKKILAMYKEDQKWRKELIKLQKGDSVPFDEDTINKKIDQVDSLNILAAKDIIKRHGFPGNSLVGESGSSAFWAIVQHCDSDPSFQKNVLQLMKVQVDNHNASGEDYAFLQDRVLVNQGQKQLYGTQVRIDLKTHRAKAMPIQDSLNVNKRRKTIGLQPLKVYLSTFEQQ